MGRSRIEITVIGNHGCDRKAKEGEALHPVCALANCIDCRARDFVGALKAAGGNNVETATHIHWPDDANGGITDDLLAGKRVRNSF